MKVIHLQSSSAPFCLLLAVLTGCQAGSPTPTEQPTVPAVKSAAAQAASEPKLPCPVKLLHPRMEKDVEEEVYATVQNISSKDITAIAFEASHTDKFGDTWEPYKTSLTSEDLLRHGHSEHMHWRVLMEEPTRFHGKPGSSELFVSRVAFSDGKVLNLTQIEGCSFIF